VELFIISPFCALGKYDTIDIERLHRKTRSLFSTHEFLDRSCSLRIRQSVRIRFLSSFYVPCRFLSIQDFDAQLIRREREREGFFFKTGCGGWSEGFPPVTQSGLKETQETAVGPLAFFNRRSRDGSQADLGDPCCYYSTASPTNRFEATKQKDKGSKIYV
jgi:hypothetical protein